MKRIKAIISIVMVAVMLIGVISLASACNRDKTDKELTPAEEVVYYSEYGAVGDGKTDDLEAIQRAHADANARGIAVAADRGATYYIGSTKDNSYNAVYETQVNIKTNTYWQDARFIIDDRGLVRYRQQQTDLFRLAPDKEVENIEVPAGMSLVKNQKNIGLTFDESKLLVIYNENKEDFVRSGEANSGYGKGSARQENILVDKYGNVDESTPITWDYEAVTKIEAYSATGKPITVSGGEFLTVSNDYIATYTGQKTRRGIAIERSDSTLRNVRHSMDYCDLPSSKRCGQAGFYHIQYTTNIKIIDCVAYGQEFDGTSYDIVLLHANNVLFKNVTQENELKGTGIFNSNYCRNTTLEGCKLNRYDAHQGVYNATLRDCTFGSGGISVTGFGELNIENVTRIAVTETEKKDSGASFLRLRDDYGSFWDGEIIIKNCKMTTNAEYLYIVSGNWLDWDYGYPCKMPDLTVDGFIAEYTGSLQTDYAKKYYYYMVINRYMNADTEAFFASKNPVMPPEYVHISNMSPQFRLSNNNKGFYDNTEYLEDGEEGKHRFR